MPLGGEALEGEGHTAGQTGAVNGRTRPACEEIASNLQPDISRIMPCAASIRTNVTKAGLS